jgi:hypothetical protein
MYCHRLTFYLDAADLAALQRLAADYRLSLAHVLRDAVRHLLADEAQYRVTLLERLGYALPTPAQAAASQQLIADAALVDLSGLIAACSPPPPALHEPCEKGTNYPDMT